MKKVWKWVIGIVIALVVIAAVTGLVLLVKSHWMVRSEVNGAIPGYKYQHPGFFPYEDFGRGMHNFPMMGPGMRSVGFLPFGGLMWIFPLGFLVLLVLGIIWLIKALRKPEAVPLQTHSCKNCGKPVQEDWRNCPYCGKKQ